MSVVANGIVKNVVRDMEMFYGKKSKNVSKKWTSPSRLWEIHISKENNGISVQMDGGKFSCKYLSLILSRQVFESNLKIEHPYDLMMVLLYVHNNSWTIKSPKEIPVNWDIAELAEISKQLDDIIQKISVLNCLG